MIENRGVRKGGLDYIKVLPESSTSAPTRARKVR